MTERKRKLSDDGAPGLRVRVLPADADADVPWCSHGPCLLFERPTSGKGRKRFYACSAYRSRKLCPFYHDADERVKLGQQERIKNEIAQEKSKWNAKELWERYKSFVRLPESERRCCTGCGRLILATKQDAKAHAGQGHSVTCLNNVQLVNPSTFLQPLESDRGEAQYFFDDTTLAAVASIFDEKKIDSVLCIGCPRVFERIRPDDSKRTFLMDIDKRYLQFTKPTRFSHYNLYNNHHFTSLGFKAYQRFLAEVKQRLMIVVDSPFALVEPLAATLEKIKADFEDRLCQTCNQYSSPLNKHCKVCNACTSKHGPTYKHCSACKRCVKPGYRHCQECASCHLPGKHKKPSDSVEIEGDSDSTAEPGKKKKKKERV